MRARNASARIEADGRVPLRLPRPTHDDGNGDGGGRDGVRPGWSSARAGPSLKASRLLTPWILGCFETRNLSDEEPCLRYPHVDQRLDLEAVAPQPPVAPG